jgi:hypothetical protein
MDKYNNTIGGANMTENRVLFYVDKDCVDTFYATLKDIFLSNGGGDIPIIRSLDASKPNKSKKEGKEWVSYRLGLCFDEERPDAATRERINAIVRGFPWASVGVTGFEEGVVGVAREIKVEMKLLGKIDADGKFNKGV